jgi:glycogen synthase
MLNKGFFKKETHRPMKVLLIGPYPPPYGGISVHVELACQELLRNGIECRVIRIDRCVPHSDRYIRINGGWELVRKVFDHARKGWMPHVHINGHTVKGWLIALACGIAGHAAPARLLTVHSGMTPGFVASGRHRKLLTRLSCKPYQRIICVSYEIQRALEDSGVDSESVEILPAYMEDSSQLISPTNVLNKWFQSHKPLLSTTLSFRPEYGFDTLLVAFLGLRQSQPAIGLVVIGEGEGFESAKQQVAACGLQNTFLLLGEISHSLCLSVMASSNIFLRATRADGDSNSVREALALGIPVIASDVCLRPPGTVLFKNGDADALADAIETCLIQEQPVAAKRRIEVKPRRLIDTYNRTLQGSP